MRFGCMKFIDCGKGFCGIWNKMYLYVYGKEKIMCSLCFFNEKQQRKKSPFNGFLK